MHYAVQLTLDCPKDSDLSTHLTSAINFLDKFEISYLEDLKDESKQIATLVLSVPRGKMPILEGWVNANPCWSITYVKKIKEPTAYVEMSKSVLPKKYIADVAMALNFAKTLSEHSGKLQDDLIYTNIQPNQLGLLHEWADKNGWVVDTIVQPKYFPNPIDKE